MSNYTPQPNTFSLFLNDKGGNEKRPDRKGDGNIVIEGKTYHIKLSGWERTSQGGKQYLSGKIELALEGTNPQPQKEDLPF
jgi:uncharacterized protein (DUF736 family)